jgi:hypothetical protein
MGGFVSANLGKNLTPEAPVASTSPVGEGGGEQDAPRPRQRYYPWRAAPVIESRLKKTTQCVALAISRRTPHSGQIAITEEALAEITGYTRDPIREAILEIIAAGLIERKRTNTGYVYRWAPDAYGDKANQEKTSSTASPTRAPTCASCNTSAPTRTRSSSIS